MDWLFGILACLDAHLPGPGGRGEELELPTGLEALTAIRDKEGGRGGGVSRTVLGGGAEMEAFII